MKRNILKIGIILCTIFFGLITVDAASFTISASTQNVTKGRTAKLTIRGNGVTGRFNISTSNSSVVSISEDRAWIENDSYTITLSALNVGTATITVTPSGVSDSSGNTINLQAKTIKITVSLPREKSNDNNLKSLSIEDFEISPSFDKNVQVYNAVIPEGTEKINIKALANESHASVTGAGEVEVSSGMNTINVIVKSETGLEKIYTINVEVKDNNPIIVNVDKNEYTLVKLKENLTKPESFEDATIQIDGYEIPAFKNIVADITLVGLKDSKGDIKLFVYKNGKYSKYNELNLKHYLLIPVSFDKELNFTKTTITINDEKVEAYKYSDKSDFVIINAKSLEDGKTALYLYDTKNNTAIRYDEEFMNETNDTIKNYTYIIIAFAGALFLTFMIIMSLLHSLRKKQKKLDKFLKKQEAKIEATRKLNDVVAEVKKITEEEKKQKEKQEKSENKKELNEPTKENNREEKEEKKLSKKEIKELKRLEKRKSKEENKENTKIEETKKEDEVIVKEVQVSPTPDISKLTNDDEEEVYDLFAEDKKKKKKKK